MGLTTAMYTGLTGLNVNQTRIETIGNNIANVNTNAFKSSRTLFQTQFSQIMNMGTAPSDASGGTNPMQVGMGALVGTTQRSTLPGALETTGLSGDMAIEGPGYFIVRNGAGREYYTRDGAFMLNANNQLVTAGGHRVRGYGVDATGAIAAGTLVDLSVPLGAQSIARATQNVILDGDLSARETRATTGNETRSQALIDGDSLPATAATELGALRSAANPALPLFAPGDTITVAGMSKGNKLLPPQQFVVGTDGATLGDVASWLQNVLGIQDIDGVPGNPGVTVENGQLVIRSNAGEPLAIDLTSANFRTSNAGAPLPFQFTQTTAAQGTGVATSFTVYDSLGKPVPVNVTFTLESTSDGGPVWRYYLESVVNGNAPPLQLGTGLITFDPQGNVINTPSNQISINLAGSGAVTPLTFNLDFSSLNGLSTDTSNVVMALQDGFPPGTLSSWAVGADGTITGTFSNGLTQALGQVALATFANEAGLLAEEGNLFSMGANSGPAVVKQPGTLGAGTVRGGALEMSNVDLSREFIGLITSSTAFQAASRVITTSSEMLDQLLLALR